MGIRPTPHPFSVTKSVCRAAPRLRHRMHAVVLPLCRAAASPPDATAQSSGPRSPAMAWSVVAVAAAAAEDAMIKNDIYQNRRGSRLCLRAEPGRASRSLQPVGDRSLQPSRMSVVTEEISLGG